MLDPDAAAEADNVSQDSPEWYQIHLATERIRIPEILFQVKKLKNPAILLGNKLFQNWWGACKN